MFGTNLFFIALGAILKYTVSWTVVGIDLHTVGVILIVVGCAGLAVNLVLLLRTRDDGMPHAQGLSNHELRHPDHFLGGWRASRG